MKQQGRCCSHSVAKVPAGLVVLTCVQPVQVVLQPLRPRACCQLLLQLSTQGGRLLAQPLKLLVKSCRRPKSKERRRPMMCCMDSTHSRR